MNAAPRVVRAPRDALLLRAATLFAASTVVGWVLERTGVLGSSLLGRLDEATGAPVLLLAAVGVGTIVALVLLKDGLRHEVRFEADALVVTTAQGRTRVRYDNVASAGYTVVGPGIALKDTGAWLATFEGSASGRRKTERVAATAARLTGCELAIGRRLLDVEPAEVVAEIRARAGLDDPAAEAERESAATV
jgi:hypothetical protein